ncbi:MAG TPA: ATP-binding protein [Nitrososphaeraceae archaeon]|nr:ATP-binding protein [Nitrososphaeraceae archaeon]
MIFGIFTYLEMEQTIKSEILKKLEIVAKLKEKNFQDAFEQNNEKLNLVSSRYQLKVELDKYNNNSSSNNNKLSSQKIMNEILNAIKPEITRFEDIIILDLAGRVVASTNDTYLGTLHANDTYFIEGKKQNNVTILYKDKGQTLKSYLTGPLILNTKLLGVVTIFYNLGDLLSMFKVFEEQVATGEINLVKKDGNGDALIINPLRFDPNASLNLTVSKDKVDTPIIQSLLKNEKIFSDAKDYRGVDVLAVTRYLENLGWGLVVKMDKVEAFAPLENLKYVTILSGILVGIAIIIASKFLGNSVSKPIQKLRDIMNEVAHGKYDTKIDIKGPEEIEELAKQLDVMRNNISNTNTHLNELVKERTEKIENAMSNLKEKEEALEESNKNLIVANEKLSLQSKIQRDFINITAHELRTPIVPIITLTELLYSKIEKENKAQKTLSKENQKKQEFLQVILRNCYRLYRLTEDILDVTKIESQTFKLNKEIVELNEIIENVVNDYKEIISKKRYGSDQIRIVYELSEENIFVNADKGRVTQVLSNILDNALKFTQEGDIIIKIKKIKEKEEIMVSIKDSGTGIDPEILPQLFNKFATKSEQGTGLGLFISKNIIEAHGGIMVGENNSGNNGSTFYFTLPIWKPTKTIENGE